MIGLRLALRLAWRNVRRYLRRSIITAGTITLGLMMMVLTIGISEGGYRKGVDTAARSGTGHVVIRSPDLDPLQPEPLVDSEAALARARQVPKAMAVPHLQAPVLANGAGGSANVLALGVDPALEAEASILPEALIEGQWLPVEPGRVPASVVGRDVAKRLDAEVGDRLVLMVQADGELQSQLTRVEGIVHTGSEDVDANLILVDLPTMQRLLVQPGGVHSVAIVLDDLQRSRRVADELAAALPQAEVLTWAEALPLLGDFIKMDRGGADVMFALLFGIVALAVLNAVLMSVLERVKEFGLMLALGTRPATLFAVVILEALILAVFSSLVGGLLGGAGVLYLARTGVDLSTLMGTQQAMDVGGYAISGVMHPYLPVGRTLYLSAMVIVLTVAGSLYPAWKAARLAPVEAIRHE